MTRKNRREFLADVGRGMLAASVGVSLAAELGLDSVFADEGAEFPTFGTLEPLVAAMQETPLEKLQPLLVDKLGKGTDLRTLVAAGALANVRSFAGHDYTGYHTFMALAPAYEMSRALPESRRALPVLKVLYRNTARIHEKGGRAKQLLRRVSAASVTAGDGAVGKLATAGRMPDGLQKITRSGDMDRSEATFAGLVNERPGEAFQHLQYSIQDEVNVHRVVLAWRAWTMLDYCGAEHAHTLLRQSVRFCVDSERRRLSKERPEPAIRRVLPKMLDTHKLLGRKLGKRDPGDAWIESMRETLFAGSRDAAADAVAAALADGISPEIVGEAISLAANELVLRDSGRQARYSSSLKPAGSVHGDSVGVHASDAANAWRNIARVSDHRNTVASLLVGAYHTAGQSHRAKENLIHAAPLETLKSSEKKAHRSKEWLLEETASAIRGRDQGRASALVARYAELGHPVRSVLDVLLRFAVSEDGALHAEKYFRTVDEEFQKTRAKFRWLQPIALARVTASEYGRTPRGDGQRAAGYEEACRLLKVDV